MLFSVIIPTFNRWPSLRRTLDSLLSQVFPADLFELIVVDDGSTDETRFGEHHYKRVIFLHGENRGPAAARNAGAGAARGEILVFTDDDCTVPQEWLHCIEELFISTQCDLLGGATRNAVPDFYWSSVHQFVTDFWQRTINRGGQQDTFLTSNNLAIRRGAFERVGRFDERYHLPGGEDRDLAIRAAAAGLRVHFAAEMIIEHHHRMTFRKFCRQHVKYGCGSFLLHTSHPVVCVAWPLYFKLLRRGWQGAGSLEKMHHFLAVLLSQGCVAWGFAIGAMKMRRNAGSRHGAEV